MRVLTKINLPELKLLKTGKVRNVYNFGKDKLLIVATDCISAFDVGLPNPIPEKGKVLTGLSVFWFNLLNNKLGIPHHLISSEVPESLDKFRHLLKGRVMVVKKTKPLPVEFVVRGYLFGSAWKAYQDEKDICGIYLPDGFKEAQKLPEPIFTPTTKAETGHDQPLYWEEYVELMQKNGIRRTEAEEVANLCIKIYNLAAEYLEKRGILLADTKFEFGICEGKIILIDEVLTPDSSRFWDKDGYTVGKTPPSLDKQPVRDWLNKNWDRTQPPPSLPDKVVTATTKRYLRIFELITGEKLN